MNEIRKVSIGPDYKSSMKYIVGQKVVQGAYEIVHIKRPEDGSVEIWTRNKVGETFIWRRFVDMPMSIEYNEPQ